MAQVDDFQAGLEWAEQRDDEARAAERDDRDADFAADPVRPTARRPRTAMEIAVAEIAASVNIRPDLPETHEMAVSLKQRGQFQAIMVERTPDGDLPYRLIFGRRRYEAMRLLEQRGEDFPLMAVVLGLLDDETEIPREEIEEIMFLENDSRVQLDAKVAARLLRRMLERAEGDVTMADLARSLGRGRDWVSRMVKMWDKAPGLYERAERGDLSFGAADLLRKAVDRGDIDSDDAEQLADMAADEGATVDDLKATITPGGFRSDETPPPPEGYDDWVRDQEEGRKAAYAAKDAKDRQDRADGMEAEPGDWNDVSFGDDPTVPGAAPVTDRAAPDTATDDETSDELEQRRERDALLDAYLLARLLPDVSDEHLDKLGVQFGDYYGYALGLGPDARLRQLRTLAADLLGDDPAAPDEIRAALDI